MSKQVRVVVEGQTEETFVNNVLAPALQPRDIYLKATLVATKQLKNRSSEERGMPGRRFKGGVSKYQVVRRDVINALRGSHLAAVTTMIDYYRLPQDFPGQSTLHGANNCYERVRRLEEAFRDDIANLRFRPFFVLHEFEALLFSNPDEIASAIARHHSLSGQLRAARNQFNSPEEIDEGPDSHPAARILVVAPGYSKRLHGPIIAGRIGLEVIRRECPHFAEWFNWLESL
jgi:hypothetical protein